MIRFTTGNIFDAHTGAIVNTVNLVGVMGKGIALQFKERFKNNFRLYREACKNRTIGIGNSLVVREENNGTPVWVINFPTKIHWRNPSEYWYVERGLDNLAQIIKDYDIKSIAIPPLGAGNGGLQWDNVKAMIENRLSNLDCDIIVFEPGHKAESKERHVRLTPARALLIYMLDRLQNESQEATAFSAVKAIYFLQKFGASDIFKLKFEPYIYGPYCDKVRHVLHGIDGAYIRGFADMNKKPFEPFDTIPEKLPEVREMIEQDLVLSDIAERTCRFLDCNWDDFSLELISSVDYLMTANPDADIDRIHEMLCGWSPRKKSLFSDRRYTEMAYRHIRESMN